jgi:hypothetical protein
VTRLGRAVVAGALALACLGGATACTSSKPAADSSSTPPLSLSVTDSPPTATDSGLPTESTPEATPTTSATSSASPSATAKPPGTDCTMTQLTVRVLRGSAAQQQEFALVTFTNKSSKACTLFGYPGVSLRWNNALLGSPAERDKTKTPKTVTLKPGEQAESQITDFSACQAPLSDTVRVYPPNLTQFADRPLELRGCRTVVVPVTHS